MRNFFERQDEARRNTTKLVVLFVLAVAGIAIGTYLAVVAVLTWSGGTVDLIQPGLALVVAIGITTLVGGGSLVKVMSLRDGGHVVAESLGGEKLARDPDSLAERRLLNVVEEMAIASGVPVPPVYVLEEDGINAFAAGYTPDDAVIGVTRGCMELLDREELQGVMAHEFSHILNEDMRLNIRLIGLLHGILLVGITGRLLMQSLFYGGGSRNRDGRGRFAMVALGLALVIIGSIGFLCGRLIKAAVSRQREFLADASAVQFTRNPDGIGGALKKIGGHVSGATVEADRAEEASHLFFGNALGEGFFASGWLSTHPPLPERIRRIDPDFDGTFPSVSGESGEGAQKEGVGVSRGASALSSLSGETKGAAASSGDDIVAQAGTVTAEQIEHGGRLREAVPAKVSRAIHEPLGAVAVAYGLLLDEEPEMRERQLRILRHRETEAVVAETKRMYSDVADLQSHVRLPVLDLAAPALQDLSAEQRERLHETIRALAEADDRLTLFEYGLATIVRHRLEHGARPSARRVQVHQFASVKGHVNTLLSGLASSGQAEGQDVRRAFRAGVEALAPTHDVEEMTLRSVSAAALDEALDQLATATPSLKEDVIAACAGCALADDHVTGAEMDLLRVVAIALDVPLPPRLHALQEEVAD